MDAAQAGPRPAAEEDVEAVAAILRSTGGLSEDDAANVAVLYWRDRDSLARCCRAADVAEADVRGTAAYFAAHEHQDAEGALAASVACFLTKASAFVREQGITDDGLPALAEAVDAFAAVRAAGRDPDIQRAQRKAHKAGVRTARRERLHRGRRS